MASPSATETWYYVRDRQKVGPVSWPQLRDLAAQGQLRPEDMVLRDGAVRWAPAAAVAGLFDVDETLVRTDAGQPDRGNGAAALPSAPGGPSPTIDMTWAAGKAEPS